MTQICVDIYLPRMEFELLIPFLARSYCALSRVDRYSHFYMISQLTESMISLRFNLLNAELRFDLFAVIRENKIKWSDLINLLRAHVSTVYSNVSYFYICKRIVLVQFFGFNYIAEYIYFTPCLLLRAFTEVRLLTHSVLCLLLFL
jgi:hypothetical protein